MVLQNVGPVTSERPCLPPNVLWVERRGSLWRHDDDDDDIPTHWILFGQQEGGVTV
jgi:hypothetical protein